MRTPKTLTVGLAALIVGAGSAAATTKAVLVTLHPGDIAKVPSRGVECGVISNPKTLICFRLQKVVGNYQVDISNKTIDVVRQSPNHGSKLVFSAKQPKS